jgi:hypothetical protein
MPARISFVLYGLRANVAFKCKNSPLTASPEMLRRYHILTVPAVLIIDRSGQVVSRIEGEDRETATAVRDQLGQLH